MIRRRSLATLLAAGLAATTAGCGGHGTDAANGKVSITVGCMPAKSQPAQRREWNEDVAAFEKLHPDITVAGKDAFPCADPKTFAAKLAGGRMEDVFYTYFTDAQNVIRSGQAADLTKYLGAVGRYRDIQPSVERVFTDARGHVYGLPRQNYAMGLLYNRRLFAKAGLDPDTPPSTWAQLRADAKRIAGLGRGIVGYADYSAGNQGGWHFTTELYAQGGDVLTPDGKKAAFNGPQGRAVLANLRQMRWTDDSMGSRQLLQLEDVQRMMASGRLGMYLAAPDNVTALVDQFQGNYADFGLAPIPAAKAALIGGDGYMVNVKDSPAKIRAGLLWLEYQDLTPGQGQFDYRRAARDERAVGLPQPNFYTGATGAADRALRARYAKLLEAAAIDGASPRRVLWSVVLPMSRPILAVVSIFAVVGVWKDFVWPLLVLPDTGRMTVSVAISSLSAQTPENVLIAALVIAAVPAIAIFFVFQRHVMAGLTAGGLKG